MPRILVVECMQEISSFNPVESQYEQFVIQRGAEVFDLQRGNNTSIGGALEVLEATPGVELVPAYSARPFSALVMAAREVWTCRMSLGSETLGMKTPPRWAMETVPTGLRRRVVTGSKRTPWRSMSSSASAHVASS